MLESLKIPISTMKKKFGIAVPNLHIE